MSESTWVEGCPRCQRGHEVFCFMREQYEFDVDRARELVRDGREPVELEEDSIHYSVDQSDIEAAHVLHVDPSLPGVIAHYWYKPEGGERVRAHLLIDGHHRAARCLREQRPFRAYLLTEEESLAVLVRWPPGSHPEEMEALAPAEDESLLALSAV